MTTPYWLDPGCELAPSLSGDVSCDVAVIGAGLCGAAATLALAKQGINVVLLEAGRVAEKATGRNAGFILQGTAERYSRAVTMMGAEKTRKVHEWTLINHRRMAETIVEEGIDCNYRRSGSLQLAGTPQEEAELEESAALLLKNGFKAELLDGKVLGKTYTDAGFKMGVLLPEDGEVHPARLVRGAVQAAMRHGATLYECSSVTELHANSPGDVTLKTVDGTVRCQLVLVCTNARARQLLPWYADKVDPVRGQMLATVPAPRIFDWPIYADHGFDYWRQDERNRIVLGGWRNLDPGNEVGFEQTLHPVIQDRMTEFLNRFEALRGIEITHRWSGIMGFSRDSLPLVGPAPGAPGALAAVGFTGHGFGFAWQAGEALAAVALEGSHPFANLMTPWRMME